MMSMFIISNSKNDANINNIYSVYTLVALVPEINGTHSLTCGVKRRNALDKFQPRPAIMREQMNTQQSSADYLCSVGWQGLKSRYLITDKLLIHFIAMSFNNLAYK